MKLVVGKERAVAADDVTFHAMRATAKQLEPPECIGTEGIPVTGVEIPIKRRIAGEQRAHIGRECPRNVHRIDRLGLEAINPAKHGGVSFIQAYTLFEFREVRQPLLDWID